MAEERLFLTELLGLKVFRTSRGRRNRCWVKDAAIVPLVDPVRIDRYLIGSGGAWFKVRYAPGAVHFAGRHFPGRRDPHAPSFRRIYAGAWWRDLLDQQIIDAQGRKVVRVTDITFEIHQGQRSFRCCGFWDVDIGMRSVFRRLVRGIVPPRMGAPGLQTGHPAELHPLGIL